MSNPIDKARNFARIAGLTTIIVTTAGLASAYASVDVDGGNMTTGANSENRNFTDVSHNSSWTVTNTADLRNAAKR